MPIFQKNTPLSHSFYYNEFVSILHNIQLTGCFLWQIIVSPDVMIVREKSNKDTELMILREFGVRSQIQPNVVLFSAFFYALENIRTTPTFQRGI